MSAAENPYEGFFNLSIDMLCVAGYDGYFKLLNPAWSRTLGHAEAELLSRPYLYFVHPDDQPATVAEAEKLAGGSTTVHFKNRYQCHDGSYRWLAWAAIPSASARRIYAIARDVTQEVELEARLQSTRLTADAQLGLLEALIDGLGVGVVLIDRDLNVAHWNRGATSLTGIPIERALGHPARQIGQELARLVEDYADIQSHFQRGLSPAEPFSFPIAMVNPHRDVEVTVSRAVSQSDGTQVGSVLVLNDISAEKELDRAKDELIGMVSHELRTPLASLVGFTELLLERKLSESQRRQYLETMLKEGKRLTDLINDFLDLQGLEGGYKKLDLGPADVRTIIARAVTAAGHDTQTPIELDLPAELPLVIADTSGIHQVLLNMLSNARKYSPGGGQIQIGARVVTEGVEVSIQDHGLGIPASALPRLFNKFYRVSNGDRRQISGTGLGLAISKRIIEGHGGRIWAESEGLGLGSRFSFSLRAATETAQSGDVLIVEDDAGFARLVEAELSEKGLSSVWAPDAETAAQLVARMTPRAMVVDLMLPGMSGEEFIDRVRSSRANAAPIIVISIKELETDEMLALRTAGVAAIIKKHSRAAKDAALYVIDALSRRAQAPSG